MSIFDGVDHIAIWRQHFVCVLDQALRSSRSAILIATPEAADSGWVQREYELMLQLEHELPNYGAGAGFHCVFEKPRKQTRDKGKPS